jgi:16S rRNA (adenine1518-N6/adenine1519-N6)-dimethyltransferase
VQTLSEIRGLLAERGLRPKRRLGQNFLHDKNLLARLVDAAAIAPGEVVLEVGPGTGTLTEALVEAGAEVIACEVDGDMAAIVQQRLGDRITLVRGDVLAHQRDLHHGIVERIDGRAFKLVANLPYQIASGLISTLLLDHPACAGQFVTIQREVADRLVARPSTKAYGPLSVIVQAFGEVQRIAILNRSCFWPQPEVSSAMVAITPRRDGHGIGRSQARDFSRFVTDLFSKRRKQLGTTIGREHAAWPRLEQVGITRDLRPEALHFAQIVTLWRETHAQHRES